MQSVTNLNWPLIEFRIQKGEDMTFLVAYFDPSAGSLVLQAVVGGFGGLVVACRYFVKQFLQK